MLPARSRRFCRPATIHRMLAVLILLASAYSAQGRPQSTHHHDLPFRGLKEHKTAAALHRTLVIYIFSNTDKEYSMNLEFFLQHAVKADDGCEYLLVMQDHATLRDYVPVTELPSNVRVFHHPNSCYDLGTIGWLLSNETVNTTNYKYVMWVNSSVRGPFMPAYLQGSMHWTTAFTSKITDKVKLVGSTINCQGVSGHGGIVGHPHIQGYVVATDQVGWQVLLDHQKTVFGCWDTFTDVIWNGELGISRTIVEAGYNLDCLMLRYQGVDWRTSGMEACNNNLNPIQPNAYDGANVDALEVMFIKVKRFMREQKWAHVKQALTLEQWLNISQLATDAEERWDKVSANKADMGSEMERAKQKSSCFDELYYLELNPDLAHLGTEGNVHSAAFRHYLEQGIADGRDHQFNC